MEMLCRPGELADRLVIPPVLPVMSVLASVDPATILTVVDVSCAMLVSAIDRVMR